MKKKSSQGKRMNLVGYNVQRGLVSDKSSLEFILQPLYEIKKDRRCRVLVSGD